MNSIAILESLRHSSKMRFLTIWSVIFSLSTPVFALDLRTALELAVSASPELKQAKSQKKEYEAQAWQYKSEIFPTINGVGTAERRLNSNSARAFITGNTVNAEFSSYTAALQFEQPIFVGLALVSGWRWANTLSSRAESEYFQTQQTIVKNLILSYFSYAESREVLRAAQGNLATLQDYSKTLAYYAKIGRGREMDRLQANVNAALAAVELQNVVQAELNAQLELKKLINWTSAEAIELKQDLHVSKHSTRKTQQLTDTSTESLVKQAFANNPSLKVAEKKVSESKYQADVELAPDLPALSAIATYGTQAIHREDMFENSSEFYTYGLQLTIPLFSGLSSVGKRREVRERTFQAEKSYEIEKRNAQVLIALAQTNLKKAYQQYQDLKDVSTRSQRALDLATRSYKQGTTTSQDVVTFQRSRYEAEKVLIQNQYAYLRALIELQELLGVDLYKTYTGAI
jgi:outer membrane protein